MDAPFSNAQHLLLFSPNWLGDVVMALPSFQQWRAAYPDRRVTVLAKPGVAALWDMVDGVGRIVVLRPGRDGQREAMRTLRTLDCDAALLMPHSFRAGWIAWRAKVPVRRGTAGQCRGWMINDPVSLADFQHQHQQYEGFHLFGLVPDTPPCAPRLTIPAKSAREVAELAQLDPACRYVALLPGAARGDSKRWPAESFAAAARMVSGRLPELRFLVCGTPAEAQVCAAVTAMIGPAAADLAGRTRLPGLAALLAQCAAVCSNDSGGMHLATAVDVPVVAVFGLTDPSRTGPLGRARVIAPAGVKVSRAIPRHSPEATRALASIAPERVAEALLEVLAP